MRCREMGYVSPVMIVATSKKMVSSPVCAGWVGDIRISQKSSILLDKL